jgi:hypothetical protein
MCPDAYSALLRTSMMVAPWFTMALKSAAGPPPNKDLSALNMILVIVNAKFMGLLLRCCDFGHWDAIFVG